MTKVLIEIPNDYEGLKGMYSTEDAVRAWNYIRRGQILSEDCEILTKEAYADLCVRASNYNLDDMKDKIDSHLIKTCDTCQNNNSHHGVCDICHNSSCWTPIGGWKKNTIIDWNNCHTVEQLEDITSKNDSQYSDCAWKHNESCINPFPVPLDTTNNKCSHKLSVLDLLKANKQLTTQIEMLKLDRACEKTELENIKNEMIDNSFCSDIYDEETDDEVIYLYKVLELIDKYIGQEKSTQE